MKRKNLEKYAKLLLEVGVNLQAGQPLLVRAPLEAKDLVEEIMKVAYRDIKSGRVEVEWRHGMLSRIAVDHASEDVLLSIPDYSIARLQEIADNNTCLLSIVASDPTLFKGANVEMLGKIQKTIGPKLKFFSDKAMKNELRWNVAAIPSPTWAKAVFPDLDEEKAVKKLWKYIFKATRADLDDPVSAWAEHIKTLKEKQTLLNEAQFKTLHYYGPGTDLYVDMPKGQHWASGQSISNEGVVFTANIPTEEVFSAPYRTGVNGKLSATLPLHLHGSLVKDFWFEFKDGKVVDYDAKEGKELLEQLFSVDENSMYLGEIALVPHDSPISNLKTIFMNTLFDENAACHFAFGKAYPECIEGGNDMTDEELLEKGLNVSLSHEDFMVGNSKLNIDGIKEDGNVVPVFKKGNWA